MDPDRITEAGARKIPYRSPQLIVYGSLEKLTLKGGNKADGGAKPSTRSTGKPV